MEKKFKELFSEIPDLAQLPKKISSVFESNKGVADKKLWQDILLQTFEKICILLAQISIYEYKNSAFAKKSNQIKGSPAYKLEKELNNSSIIKKINTLSWGSYMQIISNTRSLFNSNREYSKKFVSDEEFAKSNKLGMWSMKFDYPWDWRKKN